MNLEHFLWKLDAEIYGNKRLRSNSKKKFWNWIKVWTLLIIVSVGSGWAVELELKAQAKVLLRKEGKNSISQSDSGFSLICIYFMTRPRDKVEMLLEQKETQISKHFSPYA